MYCVGSRSMDERMETGSQDRNRRAELKEDKKQDTGRGRKAEIGWERKIKDKKNWK